MKVDELLALFLVAGDKLSRSTLAHLCAREVESEYRYGWQQALWRAGQRGLLQRHQKARDVIYALTAMGRQAVQQVGNPTAGWGFKWDGQWRLFLFDLPAHEHQLRQMLWRWLREHRFWYLQDSVWVRPEPVEDLVKTLEWFRENPEHFVLLEARRITGVSPEALVAGAWDFGKVNERYKHYLEQVKRAQKQLLSPLADSNPLALLSDERRDYERSLEIDPLLPRVLLPQSYLGYRAFDAHQEFTRGVRKLIGRTILS